MFNFNSKITRRIFDYYFINLEARCYINELAGILDVDVGNLFRKLKELEQEGIFLSEQIGNQNFFFLNKKYPFLKELKRIYNSRFGFVNELKKTISNLENVQEAYIFGSYAQENFSVESDLDILIIGDHSSIEAKRLILPIQKKIKREVNIVDLSKKEFRDRMKKKDDFLMNVFNNPKIKII
ncbi:nucleotidyltransferase domain-containing protein [bacterium]|nr:nucleotidyltransferase domain-containing protein [bacterium]